MALLRDRLYRRAAQRLIPLLEAGLGQQATESEFVVAEPGEKSACAALFGASPTHCLVIYDGKDRGNVTGWRHEEVAAVAVNWADGHVFVRVQHGDYEPYSREALGNGFDVHLGFRDGGVVRYLIDRALEASAYAQDEGFLNVWPPPV